MFPTIPIIKEKEKLYIKVYYFNKNTIKTNYVLIQMPELKLAKIFQLKRKTFCIKAIIQKFEEKIKYILSNSYIKINQESDLVIINLKLIKKLQIKIRSTNTFANYCFTMSIINGNSIKLKSQIKF